VPFPSLYEKAPEAAVDSVSSGKLETAVNNDAAMAMLLPEEMVSIMGTIIIR